MDINEATIEHLEAALEVKREAKKIADVPVPKGITDFSKVAEMVINHVNSMNTDEYHEDNDDKHYIYKAAIEAVYGKDVWKWINERC